MKIKPTPPKEILDNKKVQMGEGNHPFRIAASLPKEIVDNKKVQMGEGNHPFQ